MIVILFRSISPGDLSGIPPGLAFPPTGGEPESEDKRQRTKPPFVAVVVLIVRFVVVLADIRPIRAR
jgi:hypothetical protein